MKKDDLRKKILLNRSKVHTIDLSRSVRKQMKNFLLQTQAEVLGFYWPIRKEIDIVPTVRENSTLFRWVLPKVKNSHMGFYDWNESFDLQLDETGVPSPVSLSEVIPEVIFVPCLAVDDFGYRLGYGKGWYDRYLTEHPTVFSIGVVASEFVFPSIPSEKHDIVLDAALTEKGIKLF